jgi:hypothetical protein
MMILPQYQKSVSIRELSFSMFYAVLDKHLGRINKCYCESRTAHNITQYLASVAGCNTHAIFPNKDVFYGKRESDAFMLGFSRDALDADRVAPTKLHPKVLPFYHYIAQTYQFEDTFQVVEPIVQPSVVKILDFTKFANIIEEKDELDYIHLDIRIPGASLSALYTPAIGVIEKVHADFTTEDEFYALAVCLQIYLHDRHIQYVEWGLSAGLVREQDILLQLGYHIYGYLPAWEPCKDRPGFEDCVMLGQSMVTIDDKTKINVLPTGLHLVDLVFSQ